MMDERNFNGPEFFCKCKAKSARKVTGSFFYAAWFLLVGYGPETTYKPMSSRAISILFNRTGRLKGRLYQRLFHFFCLRKALPGVLFTVLSFTGATGTPAAGLPAFGESLPVKITVFTARYNAARNIVNLHWVTVMEKNNESFVIERSLDSTHFVVIGKARSVGNSRQSQHYYFEDPKPVGGEMFYRLREIDSTGKQYLTGVISAYKPINKLELTGVAPSDDGSRLNFAVISPGLSAANVVVADISGHVLRSYHLDMKEGANLQSIYTGDLKAGVYFLQVNDKKGNGSVMEKFTHKAAGAGRLTPEDKLF